MQTIVSSIDKSFSDFIMTMAIQTIPASISPSQKNPDGSFIKNFPSVTSISFSFFELIFPKMPKPILQQLL